MKISIDKHLSIRDIQQRFNKAFPYLKLEFFRNVHKVYKLSEKDDRIDDTFEQLSSLPEDTIEIEIDGKMTVAEVEQYFLRKTGLAAQVFRRSGNLWIETSLTDDWTLEHQNSEGELLSMH